LELTYANADGVTATLRQNRPYFLAKLDGTGSLRNIVNTFKAPSQDGAFLISSALDMRNITLEGAIIADSVDEAYALRQRLLRLFSPKLQGTLQYRDRRIACVAESVKFSVSTRQRMPNFFISLLCPSPFFEAMHTIREELAMWAPLFHFPLEIPSGIELGARQPSQIINMINVGEVPCGCEIVFGALGTVVNPELLNMDTGEYVRVNKTMQSGEELHVFTHFAGKRVVSILGGVATNAFSLLDVHSTFLQLQVGANLLRYNADEGLALLEASVYYSPLYLGV
jgi:hypothetical protein